MFDSTTNEKHLDYCDQQLLTQKKQVKFKTCADVYDYWRTCKRLYKKAPKDGVEFQVEYIDTGLALNEELRSKAPIALALHGAPGSYHDFTLLIRHLSQQNVRVIAPNFPEYTATVKTKVLFRHSADEKAAYLRDFLKAINVSKIDLLVSHSSAIFPTLLILLNANNQAIAKQQQQLRDHCKPNSTHQSKHQQQKDQQMIISSIKDISLRDNNTDNGKTKVAEENNGNKLQLELDNNSGHTKLAGFGDTDSADELEPETDDDDNADGNSDNGEEFEDAKDEVNNNDTRIVTTTNNQSELTDNNHQLKQQLKQQQPQSQPNNDQKPEKKGRKVRKSRISRDDVIVKFDQPIEIKAVALLNPAGHRLPKSMKPTWFKCGSVRIYQHKLGRSLFRKLGPAFLTVVGVPVRVDNMDNVMLSATVMRNSKCHRVVRQLQQLSEMEMPTLLVFSENDKLIEKEIFYEMTQFMKLDQKNFDIFNNDGDIEVSQSLKKDWIRVMVFKAGGHYAYSNYAKTVNKAVSELLNKVVQDPTMVESR